MPSSPSAAGSLPALPPHLDPRGKHRGRRGGTSGGRGLRSGPARIAMSVMTLLSVALLVVAGYVYYTFRNVNENVTRIEVAVGAKPSGAVTVHNGKDQNILLVGNDDRNNMTDAEVHALHVGRDGGSLATDTMMIVHIPADGKKATLISLPRDSWVHIKGYGMGKLNSPYALAYGDTKGTVDQKRLAGANLLLDTIGTLTGLTINHYIQVDLLGFYRISNAIGGVKVTMCHNVNDTVKYNESHGQGVAGSGLVLSKGTHYVKGVQALEFVRQRHNLPGGDLDRVRRQQYFLTAAFRQVASVGILLKLRALGDAVTTSIFTDKDLNLIDLAKQLENLTANNIVGKTIPNTAGNVNGQDVQLVSQTKVKAFVSKILNPAPTTSPSAAPKTSASTPAKTATSASKSASPIDAKCIN